MRGTSSGVRRGDRQPPWQDSRADSRPDSRYEERQRIFARLAVFQRLRDEAKHCGRPAMLQSIERLIENELSALQAQDAKGP
ncbi:MULTISPECIES: hypothetical protein [Ramlibacter]|uniref:Uncharacterized protein n=1 Tax=Ramlibacter aquaticus TaxID=2780094 RepID=A0ABR9SFG9_9BURK|nr:MULTISPECIES: hypothetical protein [Ramlibacter]MBE7940949.1 hypothetical protein [Ramlibacter aquaticus]